ncbi:hypothetical protein D9619_002321 [Psilocybe cf. subviscida]|uniref:Uncharacterized protein n=1 Tax=Psilocybe cf. subviscida TaxID=2480587 RepID=A0A8H5EUM8_9AGAR|nr:hypothetical protein D9619_002321 [Psilocybe cf. subviscida]
MRPLIKALPAILLRVLTVYGDIENIDICDPLLESSTPSVAALMIVERRKRMIGLIIPIFIWHGSQRQYTPTSWCISTAYTMQFLGGINAAGVEYQMQALGVVVFSLVNAAVTISTCLLYFVTVCHSTASWPHALVQLLFLALPDAIDIVKNTRRVYTTMIEERAMALTVYQGP